MKMFFKLTTLILAAVVFLSVIGCKSSNKFVLSDNDEYYEIPNEGDSGSTSDTAENTSNNSTESKTQAKDSVSSIGKKNNKKSESTSTFESLELFGDDDYYMPMQIPSRKNAYKLSNVYSKMQKGETVNVVYLGGSVTSGTGIQRSATRSWRPLTTAYLKSVSKGTVNETNAALGGTSSYLGAARFEHDVLKYNPDLLFIEFAINDVYSGLTADRSKMNLEYMINKLYRQNPYADIVIVLITNETYFGSAYPMYSAHKQVADYYNIPIVDLGGEAYNRLKGKSSEFKKLLSDSVHPNENGYKLYADIMIDLLKELLTDKAKAAHKVPSKKLMTNGFSTLNNVLASSIYATGWDLKSWHNNKDYEKDGSQFRYSENLRKIYPKYLASQQTGNKITYNFTGNSFGFLGTVKENVRLDIDLDSTVHKKITGVAKTELMEYSVFENLNNGSHTVTITVNGYTPYAAIAAFVTTKP